VPVAAPPSGTAFAELLAERLAADGNEADTAAEMAEEAAAKKEMLLSLCIMMCSGGGADPSALGLFSSMPGGLGAGCLSSVQGLSAYSLLSLAGLNPADADTGKAIVQTALTRLGDPYSTTLRGQGDYVDCSSLVQWTYAQMGISLPSTSVEQARYCYENGYTISKSELQPGDLIFWSNTQSTEGRWRQIHHVGIYAGDGKVVEAKGSSKGVVLDDLWGDSGGKWQIAMYARPYGSKTVSGKNQS
jgi:hypothetical protein